MAISNFFHRIMPKGSNPSGAVNTGQKKLQILSTLKAAFMGLGRRLKVVNAERKLAVDALGRHLPEMPLTARSGVEAKLLNIMSAHSFSATSSKGVVLSDRAAKVVRELTSEDGVHLTTKENRNGSDDASGQEALTLVKIEKKALRNRRAAMKKARNLVNRTREQIVKAEQHQKQGWKQEVAQLKEELGGMEEQQRNTRDDYMALRAAAVKLKIAEIKEQYQDSESASILEEHEALLASMSAHVFGDAAAVVRSRATRKWQDQVELRKAVDEVPKLLRRMVYKDVKSYLTSDLNYLKMRDAQSKHQMIDGTDQLYFIPGINRRLPGLPYYMAQSKAKSLRDKETGVTNEMHLIRAAQSMQRDWRSYHEAVLAEKEKIMVSEQDGIPGEFDHSRMWDYFNIDTYFQTVQWLQDLQDKSDERYNLVASYGDEIGTSPPYRFISQEDWDKAQRNKIARNYNLSSGGDVQGDMFPSVRNMSRQDELPVGKSEDKELISFAGSEDNDDFVPDDVDMGYQGTGPARTMESEAASVTEETRVPENGQATREIEDLLGNNVTTSDSASGKLAEDSFSQEVFDEVKKLGDSDDKA